jgi:hypothetical protein
MDRPRLNIDDLYLTKQKMDINRLEIYNKLLLRIHKKIQTASKLREQSNFCSFVMPQVLIGYPNYNHKECLQYILNVLDEDGFKHKYIEPNLLLISWEHWIPSHVREQYKNKTGISIDKFGKKTKERNIFKI